jgi:protein TonB
MNRNIAIVISVVLLHLGALWALHTGLLHRLASIIVPAQVLIQISPAPSDAPDTQAEPQVRPQVKPQAQLPQKNAQKVPLAQVGIAQEAPKTIAPTLPNTSPTEQPSTLAVAQATPQPTATAAASAALSNTAPSTAPNMAPAPPKVELPSSDADYLNNPKPHYPPMSKRLREQGKVVVRTLIGADGTVQQAEITQSSGFERLDQAALATALRWRYVPGKRAGVAQAMWFNVPFQFLLE